jgi:hypothetical protein
MTRVGDGQASPGWLEVLDGFRLDWYDHTTRSENARQGVETKAAKNQSSLITREMLHVSANSVNLGGSTRGRFVSGHGFGRRDL